jgi:hypothetical protein
VVARGLLGSNAVAASGTSKCRSSRRPAVSIVGGVDIHRNQLTFDYVERESGGGSAAGSHRPTGSTWRTGWPGSTVYRMCSSGWRAAPAGGTWPNRCAARRDPHLAEPAETATLRGHKRRAKTDRADAKLLRELLAHRPAAGLLHPAVCGVGMAGPSGAVSRPAQRALRLGAAHPRDLFPPGRHGAGPGRGDPRPALSSVRLPSERARRAQRCSDRLARKGPAPRWQRRQGPCW